MFLIYFCFQHVFNMFFVFNMFSIDYIKIYKQNVVYINNDDNDIINEHKKINNNKLETQIFQIRYKNIISNFERLFQIV